jgi:hypothetical protein
LVHVANRDHVVEDRTHQGAPPAAGANDTDANSGPDTGPHFSGPACHMRKTHCGDRGDLTGSTKELTTRETRFNGWHDSWE